MSEGGKKNALMKNQALQEVLALKTTQKTHIAMKKPQRLVSFFKSNLWSEKAVRLRKQLDSAPQSFNMIEMEY